MPSPFKIKTLNQVPTFADPKELTDEELSELADTGLRGQGAVVEMMSRLKLSIEKLDKTTSYYSKVLIYLTIALVIISLVQIVLGNQAIFSPITNLFHK